MRLQNTDCFRDSIIKKQTPTHGFLVAKLVSAFHNDLKSSPIAMGFGRSFCRRAFLIMRVSEQARFKLSFELRV